MEIAPDYILGLLISALPHQYEVLKLGFGGRNVEMAETLSAVMSRYSEMGTDKGAEELEPFVAKNEH